MAKKIYLSTYSLKVQDRQEDTLLKAFNGKDDFFDFFKAFADDIFQNVKPTKSYSDNVTLHITLDSPIKYDKDARILYGHISSGVGGDSFKVRASGETDTKFESNPVTDITFRSLFFYLKLPLDSKNGYLILQRKRDFGAKGSIQNALNAYLQAQGYPQYRAVVLSMLNNRIFERMIEFGNLKNIDFIKKSIPSTLEDFYGKGEKQDKGILTTSIRSSSTLNKYWKDFIKRYYKAEHKNSVIELHDGLDNLDEIEFELELKGKKKTFHILSKGRTLPDVEVSEELNFIGNEPTVESLVVVSENLIDDMLILRPNVTTN